MSDGRFRRFISELVHFVTSVVGCIKTDMKYVIDIKIIYGEVWASLSGLPAVAAAGVKAPLLVDNTLNLPQC